MEYPDEMIVLQSVEEKSIRDTILKTVSYVKLNGRSFEEKLRDDPRFSFVHPSDENYALYQYMLKQNLSIIENDGLKVKTGNDVNEAKTKLPQEPYAFSFMNYDRNISRLDLEIIRTTARFCVANENINYLEKMKSQFIEDPQFGFLNPDHILNGIFIQFMNQYKQVKSNVLGLPVFDFKKEDYKNVILRRSFQRAEFNEYSKELLSEKDKALHLQKIQFAAFDWTRFKLLDKVALPTSSDSDIPEPLDFSQLSLKKIDKGDEPELFKQINYQNEENDKETDTKVRKRKIKAAGETRLKKRNVTNGPNASGTRNAGEKLIKCPISHKMIPEGKFDRHLQILLGDPHYKIEREKYEAKHKLTNLTSTEVYENIKRIAKNPNSQA